MYLWKCWLEYRGFTLGLLLLLTAFAFLGDYSASRALLSGDHAARSAPNVFHDMQEMNLGVIVIGGILGAMFMGNAGGIGVEFEQKTSELLFTRPRKRASLVWTNWGCGFLLLESVLLVTSLASSSFLAVVLHAGVSPWLPLLQGLTARWLLAILAMLPMNMMVYGIAACGGVLCRSVSKGTLAAAEVILAYVGFYAMLRVHFKLDTPDWWFDRSYSIVGGDFSHIGLLIAWMIIALVFPFAAQKILEHRDVV